MTTGGIVVGVDGTSASVAALRWAFSESERRGVPLRVVHVGEGEPDPIDAPGFAVEELAGYAVPVLLSLSESADLVVLGHRGKGGFGGLLLGSVSQRVVMHARCPVVVVRGLFDVSGAVVAGVDDSDQAALVLAAAFEAAASRNAGLKLIKAYVPALPFWPGDPIAAVVEPSEVEAAARTELDHQAAPWRAKFPDVQVAIDVVPGGAAATLVEASENAQLVVVGSHGHGAISGTLLGSVSLQLLHHAACPIYVTRPPFRSGQ